MDLRFSLPLTPDLRDGRRHRSIIAQESSRKGAKGPNPARPHIRNPLIQGHLLLPLPDEPEKSLTERIGGRQARHFAQNGAILFLPRFKVGGISQPYAPRLAGGERPSPFLS
jgi:hypothetical protein